MSAHIDLVVIGAGIGGLTAAALAAHDGLRTVVLEAHNRPGGCAGDFAFEGLLFPAGATLLSGFEHGGLHRWVYDRLGIADRAVALPHAMEIVGPQERFRLWTDRERWRHEVRCVFPAAHPGAERFLAWVEAIGGIVHRMAGRLPVIPPRTVTDIARLVRACRPEVARTLPLLRRTVADVLHTTGAAGDPRFKQFVDAQLLDATGCVAETCAAICGAIALDLYHRGCFALPGGPAEIARDLVRSLRRDGGTIRYRTAVVRLRQEAARTWHVHTAAGEEFRTRAVVSNVPVWDMPAMLAGQSSIRLHRAQALRRHAWGAVVLHAAVDAPLLPSADARHFQTLPPPGEPLTEGGMCFITVSSSAGPPGRPRVVSASTHTDATRWWHLDPTTYATRKAEYAERMLDACERAIPGFRQALRFHRLATPRTFARYTRRGYGLVGGLPTDRRHALFGALSHRSGLPGLYLCGDSVFPGQGTIGVTLSGINAWRSVRDYLGITSATARRWIAVGAQRLARSAPTIVV